MTPHLRDGSPRELLPLGVPQIHIVGSEDEAILTNVRHYLEAARTAGDEVELINTGRRGTLRDRRRRHNRMGYRAGGDPSHPYVYRQCFALNTY